MRDGCVWAGLTEQPAKEGAHENDNLSRRSSLVSVRQTGGRHWLVMVGSPFAAANPSGFFCGRFFVRGRVGAGGAGCAGDYYEEALMTANQLGITADHVIAALEQSGGDVDAAAVLLANQLEESESKQ